MKYVIEMNIAADCPPEALDELVDQYSLMGYEMKAEESSEGTEISLCDFYADTSFKLEQFVLEHFCLGLVQEFEDLYKPHINKVQ